MKKNPLTQLHEFGQSYWYDNIERGMIRSGELARMIKEDDLRGITSNPSIFEKAITAGHDYDDQLAELIRGKDDVNARALFFDLAIEDIRQAADLLRPIYDATNGENGFVSLEVSPDLAHDTQASVIEGMELFKRLDRPNAMIKVPATKAGLPVIEQLIAAGVNVNATLLFSVERYVEVAEAYLRGLEARNAKGLPIAYIASVASFFVSRVDTNLDKAVEAAAGKQPELAGKIAVANAKNAYREYHGLFNGDRFAELAGAGGRPQRLLWASSGTKNPDYSDVLYIEQLIGDHTVNTIPPATVAAFRDHGQVAATLEQGMEEAAQVFQRIAALGVDIPAQMQQLEDEGVAAFAKSFDNLLDSISEKAERLKRERSSSAA